MLSRLLVDTCTDNHRVVALTASGPVSYAQFRAQVMAWQCLLASRPGARVALYSEDACEFAQALLGAWHAGKQVFVPGDRLPATLARLADHVDDYLAALPGGVRPENFSLDKCTAELQPLSCSGDVLVMFTSGSSGEPLAVPKNLRQLDAEVSALEALFGATLADAEIAGTVSQQHIYGLLFRVLWPLVSGRIFHAQRLATPEQIAAIPGTTAIALISSPAHLKRLPDSIAWQHISKRLCAVFSSGGPLPVDAAASVEQLLQQTPIEVFGSTETGGIAMRQGSGEPWRALPGVQWQLVDERLQIRSAHLPGDAWYTTADRARAAGQGFELLGRVDRIAKIEERRISLTAIEQALTESGYLSDARALVLTGDRAKVAVVVVPNELGRTFLTEHGHDAMAQHLRRSLQGRIDAIAVPKRWRIVDALPSNAQGKCTEAALTWLFRISAPGTLWLERSDHHARLDLNISDELSVFDGHFPGMPVLPGVALVDWAIRFGRECFSLPADFARMEALKFQSLVRPGTRLTLHLDWRRDTHALNFRYNSALGIHASGRLLFAGSEP